jgi:hypothetical protein
MTTFSKLMKKNKEQFEQVIGDPLITQKRDKVERVLKDLETAYSLTVIDATKRQRIQAIKEKYKERKEFMEQQYMMEKFDLMEKFALLEKDVLEDKVQEGRIIR